MRAYEGVAACVAIRAGRRSYECRDVEELLKRWIANAGGLSGDDIGAQRAVGAARHIRWVADNMYREWRSRTRRDVGVQRPVAKGLAGDAFITQPALVRPEGKFVGHIGVETVALVEAAQTAFRRQVQWVLRHDCAAAADRGCVVN